MISKLRELYDTYKRDGFPSRLNIQLDMEKALMEEEQESLAAELKRFTIHRSEQGQMIYPREIDDILRKHEGEE